MELDKDYKYVLVGDPAHKYLWILAREKKMDESTYNMLLQKAIDNGYDVKTIIKVEQDCEYPQMSTKLTDWVSYDLKL